MGGMLDEMIRPGPPLVSAEVVAKQLGCTGRFVLKMAGSGKITSVRISSRCVRFNLDQVLEELGVTKKGGGQ